MKSRIAFLLTLSLVVAIPATIEAESGRAGLMGPRPSPQLKAAAPRPVVQAGPATTRIPGIAPAPPLRPAHRSPSLFRSGRTARERVLNPWQIRPIDGDTFAHGWERIRIQGINTPEVSESGGFEASQRLDLLLREGEVVIVPKALDIYGRTVAEVYVNDENIAAILSREGHAAPRAP